MPIPNPLIPAGGVKVIDKLLKKQRVDTCRIRRPTQERSAGGAVKTTYGIVHSYPCKKKAADFRAQESVQGGRYVSNIAYEIEFDRNADVRAADQIMIEDHTFEVVGVPDESTFGLDFTVAANLMED